MKITNNIHLLGFNPIMALFENGFIIRFSVLIYTITVKLILYNLYIFRLVVLSDIKNMIKRKIKHKN